MAKTRKFSAYRRLQKPYTRTSRYRAKSFVRMTKNPRIVRYHMGNIKESFPFVVKLIAKEGMQVRDLALESARQTTNRAIEKPLGKENFHFHLRVYPHHILREHALASGAGADRMSSGMARPFGKPIGLAVQLKPQQVVMEVHVHKEGLQLAQKGLVRAKTKLPGKYQIEVVKREAE